MTYFIHDNYENNAYPHRYVRSMLEKYSEVDASSSLPTILKYFYLFSRPKQIFLKIKFIISKRSAYSPNFFPKVLVLVVNSIQSNFIYISREKNNTLKFDFQRS